MNRLCVSAFFLFALSLTPCAVAQDSAHLNAVLAQLDAASKTFTSARAEFAWDYYQAVVRDTTTETGSIYFLRASGGTQMGAVVTNATTKKTGKILDYRNGTLRFYDATNGQVRDLKAGSNQGQYESFLTLGFGGSGRELAKAWNITDLGSETLTDDGKSVKTEKLDLVSKDPGVSKTFTHVTIWIDTQRGVSLRQVFETPSHDRRTAVYSHIRLNEKPDTKAFAIPKNAKVAN